MNALDQIYGNELDAWVRDVLDMNLKVDALERISESGELLSALPTDHWALDQLQQLQSRLCADLRPEQRIELAGTLNQRGDYGSAQRVVAGLPDRDGSVAYISKYAAQAQLLLDEALTTARAAASVGDWVEVEQAVQALSASHQSALPARLLDRAARIATARRALNRAVDALGTRPAVARRAIAEARAHLASADESRSVRSLDATADLLAQLAEALLEVSLPTDAAAPTSLDRSTIAVEQALLRFQSEPALDQSIARRVQALLRAQLEILHLARDEQNRVEQALTLAQRALDDGRLEDVQAHLPEGLLPGAYVDRRQQLQQQAEARLVRRSELLDTVRSLVAAGQRDAAAEMLRAAALESPPDRRVAQEREEMLLALGREVAEKNPERANQFFTEILTFHPDSVRARLGRDGPARQAGFARTLARIRRDLETLHGQLESQPDDFEPIRKQLLAVEQGAEGLEAVRSEAASLLARGGDLQARRARFIAERADADALRQRGDWDAACERYERACNALIAGDDGLAAAVEDDLQRWRTAAAAQAEALHEGEAIGRDLLDNPEQGLALLDTIYNCCVEAIDAAEAALGVPAPLLLRLRDEVRKGRVVLGLAVRLRATAPAATQRAEIGALRDQFGANKLLDQLADELEGRLANELVGLRARAQDAAATGAVSAQLDALRAIAAIDPADRLVSNLTQLEQRLALTKPLSDLEAAASISGASLTNAHENLSQALMLLRDAEMLPVTVRDLLRDLLDCDREPEMLASAQEASRAAKLLAALERSPEWAARRAYAPAERWLRLAREIALRGSIATLAGLNKLLDAYEVALDYRTSYPNSSDSQTIWLNASNGLASGLTNFAAQQIGRAEELLDAGSPKAALDALRQLFREFYDRIDASPRYGDLLRMLDDVEGTLSRQRSRAGELRDRAERLLPLEAETAQRLVELRRHLVDPAADLAGIERDLSTLPGLASFATLRDEAQALAEAIAERRRAEVMQRLAVARIGAELALGRAASNQELEQARAALLAAEVEYGAGGGNDIVRAQVVALRSRLDVAIERAAVVAGLNDELEREAKPVQRLMLLQELVSNEPDPLRRVMQRREIALLQQRLDRRATYQALIDQAERLLLAGKLESFDEALAHLLQAHTMQRQLDAADRSENLDALRNLATGGTLLAQAQTRLHERTRLRVGIAAANEAATYIAAVTALRDDLAGLAKLSTDVSSCQAQLQDTLDELDRLLTEAGNAIEGGEIVRARQLLRKAEQIDPQDPALKNIRLEFDAKRRQSGNETRFDELVNSVRLERERGNLEQASDQIGAIEQLLARDDLLTDDPARERTYEQLRNELRGEQAIRDALHEITPYLLRDEIGEAQRLVLEKVENKEINDAQLERITQRIAEFELRFSESVQRRVRLLQGEDRFEEALQVVARLFDADAARAPTTPRTLSARLEARLLDQVDSTIRHAADWGREAMDRARDEHPINAVATYDALIATLEPLHAALTPDKPWLMAARALYQADLAKLIRQARIGRWHANIDQIGIVVRERLAPAMREQDYNSADTTPPNTLEEALTRVEAEIVGNESMAAFVEKGTRLKNEIEQLLRERERRSEDRKKAAALTELEDETYQQLLVLRGPHKRRNDLRIAQTKLEQVDADVQRIVDELASLTGNAQHEIVEATRRILPEMRRGLRDTGFYIDKCYRAMANLDIDQARTALDDAPFWDKADLSSALEQLAEARATQHGEDERRLESRIALYDNVLERWRAGVLDNELDLRKVELEAQEQRRKLGEQRVKKLGDEIDTILRVLSPAGNTESTIDIIQAVMGDKKAQTSGDDETGALAREITTFRQRLTSVEQLSMVGQQSAIAEGLLQIAIYGAEVTVDQWDVDSSNQILAVAESIDGPDRLRSVLQKQRERQRLLEQQAPLVRSQLDDAWQTLEEAVHRMVALKVQQGLQDLEELAQQEAAELVSFRDALEKFIAARASIPEFLLVPQDVHDWIEYCRFIISGLQDVTDVSFLPYPEPGPSSARAGITAQALFAAKDVLMIIPKVPLRLFNQAVLRDHRRRWAFYASKLATCARAIQTTLIAIGKGQDAMRQMPGGADTAALDDIASLYEKRDRLAEEFATTRRRPPAPDTSFKLEGDDAAAT